MKTLLQSFQLIKASMTHKYHTLYLLDLKSLLLGLKDKVQVNRERTKLEKGDNSYSIVCCLEIIDKIFLFPSNLIRLNKDTYASYCSNNCPSA